jgi:hypothetical protein
MGLGRTGLVGDGPGHGGRRYPCASRQLYYRKLACVGTRRQD